MDTTASTVKNSAAAARGYTFGFRATRRVVIDAKPERREEFAAALDRWLAAEPLAAGVEYFGDRVTVRLLELGVAAGCPDAGRAVDDRPRAVALLRAIMPADLVSSATVDGKDWLR